MNFHFTVPLLEPSSCLEGIVHNHLPTVWYIDFLQEKTLTLLPAYLKTRVKLTKWSWKVMMFYLKIFSLSDVFSEKDVCNLSFTCCG